MTPANQAPSAVAMEIASSVPHSWRCDPEFAKPEPCGLRCDRWTTALEIDTAIAAAVAAEREACEKAICDQMIGSKGGEASAAECEHDFSLGQAITAIRQLEDIKRQLRRATWYEGSSWNGDLSGLASKIANILDSGASEIAELRKCVEELEARRRLDIVAAVAATREAEADAFRRAANVVEDITGNKDSNIVRLLREYRDDALASKGPQ